MSTSESIPFTPDVSGRNIHFGKSSTGNVYTQTVINKQGGDLNVASSAATTGSAISAATAESVITENYKRTGVWVHNSHGTKTVRIIGAASQAGGRKIAPGAEAFFGGGGPLFAYSDDGSATAITLFLFENKIGA